MAWKALNAVPRGTVTTVALTTLNKNGAGDQVIAYTGTATAPKFLYAVSVTGTGVGTWQADATSEQTSTRPPGLVAWAGSTVPTSIALPFAAQLAFRGPEKVGTRDQLLTAIGFKDDAKLSGHNWTPGTAWPAQFTVQTLLTVTSTTPTIYEPAVAGETYSYGVMKTTVTVTRADPSGAVNIRLEVAPEVASQIKIDPASVDFAAGQAMATFDVTARQDNLVDGDVLLSLQVIPSVSSIQPATHPVTVIDTTPLRAKISVTPVSVEETNIPTGGAFTHVSTGTVSLVYPSTGQHYIALNVSGDTSAFELSTTQVSIAPDTPSVTFSIRARNDGANNGDKVLAIQAIDAYALSQPFVAQDNCTFTVRDLGPEDVVWTLTLDQSSVTEPSVVGGTAAPAVITATITRTGLVDYNFSQIAYLGKEPNRDAVQRINLAPWDAGDFDLIPITFAAGDVTESVSFQVVDRAGVQGNETTLIRAAGSSYAQGTPGTASLQVLEDDSALVLASNLSNPVYEGETATITVSVIGLRPVGEIIVRLTSDDLTTGVDSRGVPFGDGTADIELQSNVTLGAGVSSMSIPCIILADPDPATVDRAGKTVPETVNVYAAADRVDGSTNMELRILEAPAQPRSIQ
ncbi:MAG: hypothetical protein H0X45_05100 [Planctomycetes bacterium]|nr:hypothetical protein [Planctomycetota bacterium]